MNKINGYTYVLLLCILGGQWSCSAPESSPDQSQKSEGTGMNMDFDIHEDDKGVQYTRVSLETEYGTFTLADDTGSFSRLSKNEYARYNIDKNAIAACDAYYKGTSRLYYVLRTDTGFVVKRGRLQDINITDDISYETIQVFAENEETSIEYRRQNKTVYRLQSAVPAVHLASNTLVTIYKGNIVTQANESLREEESPEGQTVVYMKVWYKDDLYEIAKETRTPDSLVSSKLENIHMQ